MCLNFVSQGKEISTDSVDRQTRTQSSEISPPKSEPETCNYKFFPMDLRESSSNVLN